MSSNLKGGNPIVRLLLNHGEKLGMVGILVCAGMLIWSALGCERLDSNKAPEDLQNLISSANTHIQQFRWDQASPDEVIKAQEVNSEAMKPIPHEHFPAFKHELDSQVLAPAKLRTDPKLFAAIDLEAYGDSGIIASITPGSEAAKRLAEAAEQDKAEQDRLKKRNALFEEEDTLAARPGSPAANRSGGTIVQRSRSMLSLQGFEDTTAESWVSLVAKIPIKDQYLSYRNALASSRGYDRKRDQPNYRGYIVYRTEVTNSGEGNWQKIAAINSNKILNAVKSTPTKSTALVEKSALHPLLTYPLPSLLLREWDHRITHSEIPFQADVDLAKTAATNSNSNVSQVPQEPGGEGVDPFGEVTSSQNRRTPRRPGISPATVSPQPVAASTYTSITAGTTELPVYIWDEQSEFLLFRYIDRTAKPGRQYRYKIQLVLADVNKGVDEAVLDKAVLERQQKAKSSSSRFAPESEPSPIVSVPLQARIYLVNGEPSREESFNAEPEIEVLIQSYEGEKAAETARIDSFSRGNVVNVKDKAVVIWSNSYEPEPKEEFNFNTGITILDVAGGQALSRKKPRLISACSRLDNGYVWANVRPISGRRLRSSHSLQQCRRGCFKYA